MQIRIRTIMIALTLALAATLMASLRAHGARDLASSFQAYQADLSLN